MKKKFTLILIFSVVLCFILSFATACAHKHDFSVQKISDEYFNAYANYKSGKTYYYSCECGEKGELTFEVGEKLPCPSHNPKWITVKAPSCIEVGEKQYACDTCGEIFETQHISKSSHNFVDYKCTVCEKSSLVVGLDFEKSDFNDYYIVTGLGMTSDYNIVIPETHEGLPVKAISKDAFKNKRILSLVMPNSIISIGENAFSGCSLLKSITLSTNLTKIEKGTFADCTALESIVIREGVKEIQISAFLNCSALKSISLPNSLETIEMGALPYNEVLAFNVKDNVKYLGNSTNPYLYLFSVVNTNLTSVVVQDGCKFIGQNAFYDCLKLKNVTLPNSLVNIYNQAFYNCTALTSLVLPDGVKSISESAFYNCSSLTSVKMGNNLTHVGENAFAYCSNLKTLTLNANLKVIGKSAFKNCTALDGVYYLGSVNDWANIQFNHLESNPINYSQKLYINNKLLTKVNLSVQKVNDYAFYNYSPLTSIAFENGVTEIGNYAFYNCSSITSVNFANSIQKIGNFAFYNCDKLTALVIKGNLKSIGENAFENCASLESVVLGKKLEFIQAMAFKNCYNLNSFELLDAYGWHYTLDMMEWKNKTGGQKISLSDTMVNSIYFSVSFVNEYFYKKQK